jgi:DNA-binding MarR family transcriptional regulator
MEGAHLMQNADLDSVADDLILVLPLLHKHVMSITINIDPSMSRTHFELLFLLDDLGALPMSAVAEQLYVSKSYVTSLVDRLVAETMVERLPSKSDRRVTDIAITERGREYLREYKKLLSSRVKTGIAALSDEDLKELAASIRIQKTIIPKIRPR